VATGSLTESLGARPERLLFRLGAQRFDQLAVAVGAANLEDVACVTNSNCVIVGSVPLNSFGNTSSLVATLSGDAWLKEPNPSP
jgi:hypothetical protein